jgi:hypothetical protein
MSLFISQGLWRFFSSTNKIPFKVLSSEKVATVATYPILMAYFIAESSKKTVLHLEPALFVITSFLNGRF